MRERAFVRGVSMTYLLCVLGASTSAQASAGDEEPPREVLQGDVADDPNEPYRYREAISQAIREYNARNFVEAHALFVRAHALLPSARTLRGMGVVEFELKRYRECILHLQQALDSDVRSLDGQLRERAAVLLSRARTFVARVYLNIEPDSAQVVVDGEPLGTRPDELLLRVGDHILEFRAPGHVFERREVQLLGGEQRRLQVTLRKEVAITPATAPSPEQRRWFQRTWVWVGVVAVAAGATIATTVALRNDGPPLDKGTTGVVLYQ